VHTEGFADWFAEVSPLAEIGTLKLGSRPARRGLFTGRLEDLRAIPWVFAWSQTRVNLPGWFGLGAGLASVEDDDQFREALRDLPVLAVALENWEMSLAKSDRRIMVRYLERGGREDLTTKVLTDYDLAVARVRDLTGRPYPLANRPRLARALALRNPYVAALSHLQIRALGAIRGGQLDEADEVMASRLLGLTINGVAAGLQNTG
jgi:phosphoenolpyruvate carboxylase